MGEPGDGANSLGAEPKEDAHRPRRQRIRCETARQLDGADHACAVVVGLRGMAGVGLDDDLARFGVGSAFGVDDRSGDFESSRRVGDEFGSNHSAIFFVAREFIEDIFRQAETPVALVVLKDPWDGVRTFLVEVQVRLQFIESQGLVNGQRIGNDVQRIVLEIHHALAATSTLLSAGFNFKIGFVDNVAFGHLPRPHFGEGRVGLDRVVG